MKIHQLVLSFLALSIVSSGNVFAADEANGTGTVSVKGYIGDQTCFVSSAQLDQNIDFNDLTLDKVSNAAYGALISDGLPATFDIYNCSGKTKATMHLHYATKFPIKNYTDNQGTATGFGIVFLDKFMAAGAPPQTNDYINDEGSISTDLANNEGQIKIWVGLQKKSEDHPLAGTIVGDANVSMTYE